MKRLDFRTRPEDPRKWGKTLLFLGDFYKNGKVLSGK